MCSEVKEKNISRKYIRQLILHFIEKYTICGLRGSINNEECKYTLNIPTLEGSSLYLENLDYSFQTVISSIVLKYNEQLQKILCDNPNIREVYLLKASCRNCSFRGYQNKEIVVVNFKGSNEDIKIQSSIKNFLDNFLALPCEELIVGEHFWENTEGDKVPLYAWTLKKGNLLVYCDSIFYSYVENKIKEQEEQGIKLCRMLDGGEIYE